MRLVAGLYWFCAVLFTAGTVWAGGSGFNVIVVVNQHSTNSVQLGNAYCEQRGVPPQNVLRMTDWTGGAIEWSRTSFETCLLNPLLTLLAGRGLTNQAELVLLSMDIPYTVAEGGSYNSTTSALFYGFKTNTAPPLPPPCLPATCSLPDASFSSYAFSELPFRDAPPDTAPTSAFLAMMLTHNTLAAAEAVLARGVASDSTWPTQRVYLAQTADAARNVRYIEFDNALIDTRIRGQDSLVWTNTSSTAFTNLLGLQTGLANLTLPVNAFVPGAMGDSLTSYAGGILGFSGGQTDLLAFLTAGAAGSYGTVKEPCNWLQKFPNPLNYFYQHRGFCLAEAYYQSLLNPYQGLLVGEPLSAPFARRGIADWSSLTNNAVLSGQAGLNLTFSAAATNLPLSRADLFLDGTFLQTVTNLLPTEGNVASVTLNGVTVNYAVPVNATVASVVTGLAAELNAQTNATRVWAYPTGDRLELQSLDVTVPGSNVTLSASASLGSAAQLTTQLAPARPTFLDTPATGYLGILASNTLVVGDWLQLDFTKTNGAQVTVSITNTTEGTTIATLLQNLQALVNANPALQSADGVLASDFGDATYCGVVAAQLTLYARSPGWPASQVQVAFTASTNLLALPMGTNQLQDNLYDLRPRNHLYVSSGATSLPVSFLLDTTQIPDGFHELTAVAYEGTSVRTQSRISRSVRVQNTALTADFTPLLVGTNATLDMPLQFQVTASAQNFSRIELFSTGGTVGVLTNQASGVFTAPSALLGLGVHPFYALVTDTTGNRYRTQTAWIRLLPSFKLNLSGTPPKLSWPALTGLRYDILTATNFASPFQWVTSVVASGSLVQWPTPAPAGAVSFYRVSLSP
ncbi:MAG TPA: TIGR03790 family protein [Candidatus Paceibacterota bacterium]|nr:TIGR03790 family protein [Verrucomicrobiota bacterium]HSA09911.1 TIGR03790 family protein [Candidatus Paceibacterota bacterium]